jgi:ankyrin repeat protein
MTTIFDAIDADDAPAAVALVDADPALATRPGPDGETPILRALYRHHFALARDLAAAAARHGVPLGLADAAATDDEARVRAALAAGAEPDARTPDGFTPLQLAAYFGAPHAAGALIAAGADPDAVADNPMRIQPLHAAAAGRHGDVASLLIAAGADVNGKQRHGWTPLHSAAHNGDGPLVDDLLAAGADRSATNDDGHTAARLATEAGHPAIAARVAA